MLPVSRRSFLEMFGAIALAPLTDHGRVMALTSGQIPSHQADLARPTAQQLAWQERDLSMFLHFGMNTFTNREWGTGAEDPRLFDPGDLDAAQWVHVAKAAGFQRLILTAKHHDGFCLWPSAFTDHSVRSSPWRGGKGDVVREFADACRSAGLEMGLYLSPWDRHEPTYGDSPAYNLHFVRQLEELLTRYGEVTEVWFDGANGEGPNGKKQTYDWATFYAAIRHRQPNALIAISGPDIRWVGNEDGVAHETEWCAHDPDPVFHHGVTGKVWWPSECDVSIRPGWFWHASEDAEVKSLAQLIDIYCWSAGRNSVLLLNVPPNDRGLISAPDIARLTEMRSALQRTFARDLALRRSVTASSAQAGHAAARAVDGNPDTFWTPGESDSPASLEVNLKAPRRFDTLLLQEHIALGQRVAGYRMEARVAGEWRTISTGTTIGHKKIDRFGTVTGDAVRLTIEHALAPPLIRNLGIYSAPSDNGPAA